MQATKKKPGASGKKAIHTSNEAQLDPKNPIPFDLGGTVFSFVNQSAYLPFLAPKDTYGQLLLEAKLLSTTNNACITKKKDYCAGQGFHDSSGRDFDQSIIDWFSSLNRRNEPALEINKLIFDSHFTYGNTPIELVRYTVAGKRYLNVYVHNFLEWRLGKPDEDDVVTYAIRSKLFLREGLQSQEQLKGSRKVPIYNPSVPDRKNWMKDDHGAERTMIWYRNAVTGFPFYGLPSNVASMIYQILEYKGARYNLDNFDNNMVLGGVLALKGNLGQSEANRIGREIINTHTGDGKRGRVAVVASEEGIDGSDFHDYDTTKDGSYTEADDKWTQKIILANDWDAVLAGIISPSTLGKGSGFITKIAEIKQNTTIRPAQTDLISKVWAMIFKIGQEWLGLPFDQYEIGIKQFVDISGLTDVDITPAVQINEVRVAKGLPEDPAMDGVYMKQPKAADPQQGGDNVPA